MKKWHVVVLVFLALATILFIARKFCFAGPSVCGARDARADLAHGHDVLPDYGFPFGVQPETDQCFRRHGLEVRVVGLDTMNDSERSYYSSYVSVMNTAIAQKFSPDVFEQCCRYQPISIRTACRAGQMSEIRMFQELSAASVSEGSSAREPQSKPKCPISPQCDLLLTIPSSQY